MKHRGWLKIGRDNFDRSEIWMECAQKRTARRKSDMENYAAVESVSAGSWNDCFSSSFISACHHARFPCKRRGPATRRAWSKSNQLDFKLSVTLAAFFHPPSPSSSLSSYFPFHHRDLMHLKCVSKISSFFFKKKKLGKQFDLIRNSDRNEGRERKNIPSNGKIIVDEKKGKEKLDRRISNASLFIKLLLLRRHFFLSSIRGNDIYISGFASSVCERTFRGIGP